MTRSEEGERTRGKANEREREIKRGSTRERDDSSVTEERRRSETERERERERGRRRRNHGDDYDEEDASKRRRSMSPSDRYSRHNKPKPRSHSPEPELRPRPRSRPRHHDEVSASRGDDHGSDVDDSISKMQAAEEALQAKQKEKPSFELSGKLAAETNRVRGVTLLFNEPPDAAKPNIRWRLYVFKNGESLNEPLYIHRQSCYLFGRERRVADIPTDHPSCSKQHAVIQFRKVEKEKHDGMLSKQVRPYLMDLGSTNKTFINDSSIEPQRYYELHEQDTIKFGNSSREYVLLHENSAT